MSIEASVAPGRSEVRSDVRADRTILRLAFGVAGSFVVAEALDWDFTFLGPMFAAQLLLKPTGAPTLKQAIGALAVIALAMGFSLLVTAAFISSPWALVLAFLLVLYLSFYALARGVPDFITLMVQIGAITVPVLAVLSTAMASDLATTLLKGMATAMVTAWVVHAVFPDPAPRSPPAQGPGLVVSEPRDASWFALSSTLVLAPMLVWYLLDATQVALVLLITILMVVRQFERRVGRRAALGMIVGNVIGGVAASLVYNVIQLQPNIVFLAVICLASSLVFATCIVRGGPLAPIYTIAFTTFILLLALGLSPLPTGSEEAFASRLVNVLLATTYAVGALSMFGGGSAPPASEP